MVGWRGLAPKTVKEVRIRKSNSVVTISISVIVPQLFSISDSLIMCANTYFNLSLQITFFFNKVMKARETLDSELQHLIDMYYILLNIAYNISISVLAS